MPAQALIKYTFLFLSALGTACVLPPQLALAAEQSKLVHQAAVLRINRHNYKDAVQLLLSASAQDRKDPAYDAELACSLLSNGQADQCIDYSTKMLPKSPATIVLYRCRALAYKERGDYQKSIADFTKLIALSPMVPANYNDRAALYKALGQFEPAQKDLTKASNIQRYSTLALDDSSLQMTRLVRAGHYKEAERILPKYLAGQPEKIFYLSDIAKGFALGDRNDAAIKSATRYLQLAAGAKLSDPLRGIRAADETSVRELLATQYIKQKNSDKALAVLNAGIAQLSFNTQNPDDSDGQGNRNKVNLSRLLAARAEVYITQGKRDSAREDSERSLSLFPDSIHAGELLKRLKSSAK
jgi:tetratricopeptide (TPR) repeat protein